jgi:Ca2+-transporting ATPase
MAEAPRDTGSGLFSAFDYLGIAYAGVIMAVPAVALSLWPYIGNGAAIADYPQWSRSMSFAVLGFGPLFHVWNCRSRHLSMFAQRPIWRWPIVLSCLLSAAIMLVAVAAPGLHTILHTVKLSVKDYGLVVVLSALVIPAVEAAKALARWSAARRA